MDFTAKRPCRGTRKSHIDHLVLDTQTWEASATFRLERCAAVRCYARNDHLGLMIPYQFQRVDHHYEPDFIVRLSNGVNVIPEVKGFEDAQTAAKHNAARRWVDAVNHASAHGQWLFQVCRDPQTLERELELLLKSTFIPPGASRVV